MKKFLIAGLLVLGVASAQTAAVEHEQMGALTWQSLDLHGKVKYLERCDAEGFCTEYSFNVYGVEINTLWNRKWLGEQEGHLVFERPIRKNMEITYRETFGNGLLLKSETVNAKGKITEMTLRAYNPQGRQTHTDFYALNDNGDLVRLTRCIQTYVDQMPLEKLCEDLVRDDIYEKSYSITFDAQGRKKYWDFGAGPEPEMSYDLDEQGNWIRSYSGGELAATQKIEYH